MDKKPGRNDPCPCGSGKKFKACCWKKNLPQGRKNISAKNLTGTAAALGKAFQQNITSSEPLAGRITKGKLES